MNQFFWDEMPLGDARMRLRTLVDDGHACPCCTQFAKVYRRKVNSSMARDMIALYRAAGTEYAHLPSVRKMTGSRGNREESKLRYWSLIEEETALRPDGGRAGWWRITPLGVSWVLFRATIPKYAHVYDGRCLGLHGELVTIVDALGDRFSYRELMDQ